MVSRAGSRSGPCSGAAGECARGFYWFWRAAAGRAGPWCWRSASGSVFRGVRSPRDSLSWWAVLDRSRAGLRGEQCGAVRRCPEHAPSDVCCAPAGYRCNLRVNRGKSSTRKMTPKRPYAKGTDTTSTRRARSAPKAPEIKTWARCVVQCGTLGSAQVPRRAALEPRGPPENQHIPYVYIGGRRRVQPYLITGGDAGTAVAHRGVLMCRSEHRRLNCDTHACLRARFTGFRDFSRVGP